MSIAIGGWLLVLLTSGAPTIPNLVASAPIVQGYDTAEECEKERFRRGWQRTHRCIPALATVTK